MKKTNFGLAAFVVMLAVSALLLGSCVQSPQKRENPILGIAAFDLNCPKGNLSIKVIERTVWGVSGCGRRGRYIYVCRRSRQTGLEECTWIADFVTQGAVEQGVAPDGRSPAAPARKQGAALPHAQPEGFLTEGQRKQEFLKLAACAFRHAARQATYASCARSCRVRLAVRRHRRPRWQRRAGIVPARPRASSAPPA